MATPHPKRGRVTPLRGRRAESTALDGLVEAVRAGESRVLVVRGEPGMGKTALLDRLAGRAAGCRVVRAAGVQSEMELAFAGLHQLCAPMLDHLEAIPVPQRDALRIAFGIGAGPAPAELAGGFGLPGVVPLLGRIEESFRRRIEDLPKESRLLVLAAAAEPTGDSSLVWRAAGRLGIGVQAAAPAAEAGLVEFGAQVRFRHPLVRSAAHGSASAQDLREVHHALAEATDPAADPDRRAWHLAQATAVPDEDVAEELERSAGRAQARGGLAAAAAFLERAAILTPNPVRRAQRLLAGARAKRDAGALDAALGLLVAVEAGPLGQLQTAEVEHMRGQIALDQRRGSDAARLLLSAARRLEPLKAALAREAYLEALWEAAMWAGDLDIPGGVREVAEAAHAAPPGLDPPRVVDVLLDAFALLLTQGHAAAAPAVAQALKLVLALDFGTDETGRWLWRAGGRISQIIALELWDAESWHALATRQAQFARGAGALVHLQFALNYLARAQLLAGDLATATLMVEEDRLIAEATGNPPVAHNAMMMLAAWRGWE